MCDRIVVHNDPVNFVDPNGQWIAGAVIGFFAGGIGGFSSGMIGHSSLLGAIGGGLLGGVLGSVTGGAVGLVAPPIVGIPASSAAGAAVGALAGGTVGGVVGGGAGGALSSYIDTGRVTTHAVVTGMITGGGSGLIASPGTALAAWATWGADSAEVATGLIGASGGIMGDTAVATGNAIRQGNSCGN